MEYQQEFTHALLMVVISNDLEWLSEIFYDNSAKHRAVFLRQLSFLLDLDAFSAPTFTSFIHNSILTQNALNILQFMLLT